VRRSLLAAPLAVLLAVDAVACTGGSDAATGAVAPAAGAAAAPEAALDTAVSSAPGTAPDTALARVAPAGAELVRTADLAVRVDDVAAAARRAGELARSAGARSRPRAAAAPPARRRRRCSCGSSRALRRDVDALGALGEQTSRTPSARGRHRPGGRPWRADWPPSAPASSGFRALLDRAGNLGEVVQVEGELTRRTADLESLQARLAALTERVDRSTITLRLYDGEQAPQPAGAVGFDDGLRGGWAALLATGRVAAATLGALLPFLPFVLLAAVAWRLRARRAARRPDPH
jgi:hypothetical protein